MWPTKARWYTLDGARYYASIDSFLIKKTEITSFCSHWIPWNGYFINKTVRKEYNKLNKPHYAYTYASCCVLQIHIFVIFTKMKKRYLSSQTSHENTNIVYLMHQIIHLLLIIKWIHCNAIIFSDYFNSDTIKFKNSILLMQN